MYILKNEKMLITSVYTIEIIGKDSFKTLLVMVLMGLWEREQKSRWKRLNSICWLLVGRLNITIGFNRTFIGYFFFKNVNVATLNFMWASNCFVHGVGDRHNYMVSMTII